MLSNPISARASATVGARLKTTTLRARPDDPALPAADHGESWMRHLGAGAAGATWSAPLPLPSPRQRCIACVRQLFPRFRDVPDEAFTHPGHPVQGAEAQLLKVVDPSTGRVCFIKVLFAGDLQKKYCAVKDVFTNHMLSNIIGSKRTNNQVRALRIDGQDTMVSLSHVAHAEDGGALNLMSEEEDRAFRKRFRDPDIALPLYDFDAWARQSLLLRVVNDGDAVRENRQRYYCKHGKLKEVVFDSRFDIFSPRAEADYRRDLGRMIDVAYNEYGYGGDFESLPTMDRPEFERRFVKAVQRLVKTYPDFQRRVQAFRSSAGYREDCAMWRFWAAQDFYADGNTRVENPALHPAARPEDTLARVEQRYREMVEAVCLLGGG